MNLSELKYVYLLGIGGIGMSAVARYFNSQGKKVSGYDKTPTSLTDSLIMEGISIHFEDNIEMAKSQIMGPEAKKSPPRVQNVINPAGNQSISEPASGLNNDLSRTLIIYTPAIPKNHREFNFFKDNGYILKKRSEVLGMITRESFTIAVAGTHGKTSTVALITHILKCSGVSCTAFVGGIMCNYNSNILIGAASPVSLRRAKRMPVMVVEADEYDRSFLTLDPDIAVITSMDADHLDIYGEKKNLEDSFNLFAGKVKNGGTLIYKKNLPVDNISSSSLGRSRRMVTYSILDSNADYSAKEIKVENGNFVFEVNSTLQEEVNQSEENKSDRLQPGEEFSLSVPGRHNVENALAALAAGHEMGVSKQNIKRAFETFRGVKRRFEFIIKTKSLIFIDDYAHHPEELTACIKTARELYPEKKITGIFQPHLFSRTRDFADGFARSLELLDEVILLEIYPAREAPIEGVSSQMLLAKIRLKDKTICQKEDLCDLISRKNTEVLITLGAGDIDALVSPISVALHKKISVQKNC